jgi:hypothetical protein
MIFAVLLLVVGCIPKPGSDSSFFNLPGVPDDELEEKEQLAKEFEEKYGEFGNDDIEVQMEVQIETSKEKMALIESLNLQDDEYFFQVGDSMTMGNSEVTILGIESGPQVNIEIEGIPLRLVETKSDEIANDVVVTLQKFNFRLKDSPENYVVLKVLPLELGLDEYLLTEKEEVSFTDNVFTLNEVRSDGSIYFDIEPSSYSNERITAGSTKEYEGLEISPIKTFTKDSTRDNYAIVKIVEL